MKAVMLQDWVEIDERIVEIEITKHPELIGAYDPIQDVIFLNHKLLEHPDLLKYVLKHEKQHAKHPKGIGIHTWIDIKNWSFRPWATRKAMSKLINRRKYWRTALANLFLMGFFIIIMAGPVFLILELGKWLFG